MVAVGEDVAGALVLVGSVGTMVGGAPDGVTGGAAGA